MAQPKMSPIPLDQIQWGDDTGADAAAVTRLEVALLVELMMDNEEPADEPPATTTTITTITDTDEKSNS